MANIDCGVPTLQRNLMPPSSWFRVEVSYPEDGGSRFLQNIHNHLPDYILSTPQKIAIYP
jgi:D-mannonate dehydratase